MSGQELYERYAEIYLRDYNCSMDLWADLHAADKNVWNKLADGVKHKDL